MLAESGPINPAWQRDISITFELLGVLAMTQGDLPNAHRFLTDSLRIRQSLTEMDPNNAEWQRDCSFAHWRLANLLEKQGDPKAIDHFRKAQETLDSLVHTGAFVSDWDHAFLKRLQAKLD